jgi:hypothetical protein
MIVTGVLLSIVVALLRGGKLERLSNLNLTALPLVFAAILLRTAAGYLAAQGFALAPWLQVVAYAALLYMVALNLGHPGIKLFGLGSLCNSLVIAANGGTMPVSAAAMAKAGLTDTLSGTYSLLTEQSRLWFLADIIPVTFRYPKPIIVSVGDLIIVVGMFIFIQYRMMQRKEPQGLVLGEK